MLVKFAKAVSGIKDDITLGRIDQNAGSIAFLIRVPAVSAEERNFHKFIIT